MRVRWTDRFRRDFHASPATIQGALEKPVAFLIHDLRHPSLRAKKFDEAHDICQARVTGAWRFSFRIEGDTYQLLTITRHPE